MANNYCASRNHEDSLNYRIQEVLKDFKKIPESIKKLVGEASIMQEENTI